jgi:VanZ family protein
LRDRPSRNWTSLKLSALLVGALALVIAAHLFEPHYFSRTAKAYIKSLHAPGFAVVSAALALLLKRCGLAFKSYAYAAAGALAAGVLSELAQLSGPRHAELSDLLKDVVGICAGLGLVATFDTRVRRSVGAAGFGLLLLITGIAVTASLRESVSIAYALVSRNAALPVLLSFDQSWEYHLYQEAGRPTVAVVHSPPDWPAENGSSVLRTQATGRYNTFLHLRPYPDWRGYDEVSFIAASADENSYEVTLTVRDIRPTADSPRNSFHGRVIVTPDPRRFSFRLEDIAGEADTRPFDFAHIDIVILSLASERRVGTVLLDDFRLR